MPARQKSKEARADSSPETPPPSGRVRRRLHLLTGAVHLLDILFRFAHKIPQRSCESVPHFSPQKNSGGAHHFRFRFLDCVSDLAK